MVRRAREKASKFNARAPTLSAARGDYVGAMRRSIGFCALIAAGCSSAEPGDRVFPAVDALPELAAPPDPFASFFEPDRAMSTAAEWNETRRPEIEVLFQHYVYGYFPQAAATPVVRGTIEAEADLFGGQTKYRSIP